MLSRPTLAFNYNFSPHWGKYKVDLFWAFSLLLRLFLLFKRPPVAGAILQTLNNLSKLDGVAPLIADPPPLKLHQ